MSTVDGRVCRRLIVPPQLLKTLGRLNVRATAADPTYHLVASSVGLLVFLDAVDRTVLFAAAPTATGKPTGPLRMPSRPTLSQPEPGG